MIPESSGATSVTVKRILIKYKQMIKFRMTQLILQRRLISTSELFFLIHNKYTLPNVPLVLQNKFGITSEGVLAKLFKLYCREPCTEIFHLWFVCTAGCARLCDRCPKRSACFILYFYAARDISFG